jgi:hypothetical protein
MTVRRTAALLPRPFPAAAFLAALLGGLALPVPAAPPTPPGVAAPAPPPGIPAPPPPSRGAASARRRTAEAALGAVLCELYRSGAGGRPCGPGDPSAPALMERAWGQVGAWASAYLDLRPETSGTALARALRHLAAVRTPRGRGGFRLRAEALDLGPHTRVMGVTFTTRGAPVASDVLVLDRKGGAPFRVAWNLLEPGEAPGAKEHPVGHRARLARTGPGALSGSLHLLAPDLEGRARFLVAAGQCAEGGTQMGQLGFWAWDGERVLPLLVQDFRQEADHWRMVISAGRVSVRTKEDLEHLPAHGSRPGAQASWDLDVTPRGIVDRGRRLFLPEFRVLDELLGRVLRRQDASDLAAPVVAAALGALVEGRGTSPFGALEGGRRLQMSDRTLFEATFGGRVLTFTVERRQGRPWFGALESAAP